MLFPGRLIKKRKYFKDRGDFMKRVLIFIIILIGLVLTTGCTVGEPNFKVKQIYLTEHSLVTIKVENTGNASGYLSGVIKCEYNYNFAHGLPISPGEIHEVKVLVRMPDEFIIEIYSDGKLTDTVMYTNQNTY